MESVGWSEEQKWNKLRDQFAKAIKRKQKEAEWSSRRGKDCLFCTPSPPLFPLDVIVQLKAQVFIPVAVQPRLFEAYRDR